MIPQKDAFSAIFCDSSCFVKDKNGNGKTIFNSQWIPYIDLDKYSFSRNLAVIAQNPSCEDSFESVTKNSKKVKTCLIVNNKTLFPDEKYYGLITSTDCKVKEFSLSSFSLFFSSRTSGHIFIASGLVPKTAITLIFFIIL